MVLACRRAAPGAVKTRQRERMEEIPAILRGAVEERERVCPPAFWLYYHQR